MLWVQVLSQLSLKAISFADLSKPHFAIIMSSVALVLINGLPEALCHAVESTWLRHKNTHTQVTHVAATDPLSEVRDASEL